MRIEKTPQTQICVYSKSFSRSIPPRVVPMFLDLDEEFEVIGDVRTESRTEHMYAERVSEDVVKLIVPSSWRVYNDDRYVTLTVVYVTNETNAVYIARGQRYSIRDDARNGHVVVFFDVHMDGWNVLV